MVELSSARRTYKKAPIIEAIVEFRFADTESFDFQSLESSIQGKFSNNYPNVKKQIHSEFRIGMNNNLTSPSVISHEILRFSSQSEKNILHLKPDSFAFSQLAPYGGWDSFISEARKSLNIFLDARPSDEIIRIALRFINRFDFPGPSVELTDYLKIYPQLPSTFDLNAFTMQSILTLDEIKSVMVVRQALVAPSKPDIVSILLDFDLFNEEKRAYTSKVWDFLDVLHEKKNQFFESSITDKTRELIL